MGEFKGYLWMPLILFMVLNILLFEFHVKIHLPYPILKHIGFYCIIEILLIALVSFLSWFKNAIRIIIRNKPKDVDCAIDIYDNRIKDKNRCSLLDLRRWIAESNDHAKDSENPLIDYLVIAKKSISIEGFIFITHYFKDRLSFVSYLVTTKRHDPKTSRKLFESLNFLLNNQFNKCDGVIAEIPKRKDKINHYFQLYDDICDRAGYKLWELPITYLEPIPLFKAVTNEREMVLVYAEPKAKEIFNSNNSPSKDRMIEILKFTYLRIYWDSIEKDFEESHIYLEDLFQRVLELNKGNLIS